MTSPDPSHELSCERCEVARDGDSLALAFGNPAGGDGPMAAQLRVVVSMQVASQLRDTLARALGTAPSMPRLG
jgi:hypothetical protein